MSQRKVSYSEHIAALGLITTDPYSEDSTSLRIQSHSSLKSLAPGFAKRRSCVASPRTRAPGEASGQASPQQGATKKRRPLQAARGQPCRTKAPGTDTSNDLIHEIVLIPESAGIITGGWILRSNSGGNPPSL